MSEDATQKAETQEEEPVEEESTGEAEVVKAEDDSDPDLEWFKKQAGEVLRKSEKRVFGPAIKGLRAFFNTMKED